mmetsp:Transcript_16291/g.40539  ORF Transcript_16291/g.40539 Transcript_16291/m.40539 type:complete len:227 (+) Transcript_16291:350-1030(+)
MTMPTPRIRLSQAGRQYPARNLTKPVPSAPQSHVWHSARRQHPRQRRVAGGLRLQPLEQLLCSCKRVAAAALGRKALDGGEVVEEALGALHRARLLLRLLAPALSAHRLEPSHLSALQLSELGARQGHHLCREGRALRHLDAERLVARAVLDLVQHGEASRRRVDHGAHVAVGHPHAARDLSELVEVGGEQRGRAHPLHDVLRDGPCKPKAVVRGGAAPQLINDDE